MQTIIGPMGEIPQNDAEAREALRYKRSEIVRTALIGFYNARRAQGDDILDAYRAALRAHLEAFNKAKA